MKITKRLKINIDISAKYIILLFVSTRIVLALIGVSSRALLSANNDDYYIWRYTENNWLDIWSVWDSGWYLDIAKNGYTTKSDINFPKLVGEGQNNYGFFPLYPLLIRVVNIVVGNYHFSAIIISNAALIISSVFLYKLVSKDDNNDTAKRSIKYLFLFPTAFILSGVFSEALFLALLLSCVYYAKGRRWFLAGILGFFMVLTKPVGILMSIPLLFEYLRSSKFNIKEIKFNILYLLFIPAGLLAFMLFTYFRTGDILAYFHAKQAGWLVRLSNPLEILLLGKTINVPGNTFITMYTLVLTLFFYLNYQKLNRLYVIIGILLIAFPLFSGLLAMMSIPRHSLIVFPFFILLAKLGKDKNFDKIATFSLAFLQGLLMIAWSNGLLIV